MKLRHLLILLGLTTLFPLVAAAQGPPPEQPDMTVTAAMKKAVVDTLAERVDRLYVFPDKARETAKALRKRLAAHEYDGITSAREFSDSLTAHVRAVTHDLHLRVGYRYEPVPPMTANGPPPEAEMQRMRTQGLRTNYGFERVERLPGNVGYLDLRQFAGIPEAQATAVAAMNFLGNVDALIVDLRRNGGGSPEMIATLLTYLTGPGDRLMFNTFYEREEDRTLQFWTNPYVPGPRLNGKPVYVLTSPRTFSAAEEFAYDIQTHKLGTLVGATTGGGANPGGFVRVHEHFMAFISTGRAVNPVTRTNWEGVGVKPDIEAKPGEALRVAHVEALKKILESVTDDPDRKAALNRALDEAGRRVADPEEDFMRPGPGVRRRT
jgi:peptidase S41-like protein